jgi:uncharacterized protein
MSDTWIQTFTGRKFDLLEVSPEQIQIKDIAHALSLICRFAGHTRKFYSVADHSIFVSKIVPKNLKLAALLHDAAEAYLGDISRPLKQLLKKSSPCYSMMEDNLNRCIEERFALKRHSLTSSIIIYADNVSLSTEKRDLLNECEEEWGKDLLQPLKNHINPLSAISSETLFLAYYDIYKEIK